MKTRESEIFNEYAKKALEDGVISQDDLKKEAQEKVRYDSKSFSDIEALYGHKFEPNKGEDESIIDVAHPETMVVGPAYDAMNAVVENEHQRKDIMTFVALKDPDGHLVQRRYVKASGDLISSLVSTGFAMDDADEEALMKLADSCAGRLSEKGLKKKAWANLAFMAAMTIGPYIYDYVVKTQAERATKGIGGSKEQKAKAAKKAAPMVNRRIKGGFKRLGLGLVLITAYDIIKEQIVGNLDRGVDTNAQTLQESLVDLAANVDPMSHGPIYEYIEAVNVIRDANLTFSQQASTYDINRQDFYAVEGAKESRKFIDDFYNNKIEFDKATAKFGAALQNMSVNQPNLVTDSDIELALRKAQEALTGSKVKVQNAMDTLSDSLNDMIGQITTSISAAKTGIKQVEENVAKHGEDNYVNYVDQVLESEPES